MRNELLSYDDLVRIVELIRSAETFSEFHLKVGDIELDLRKHHDGRSAAQAGPQVALPAQAVPTSAPPAVTTDSPGPSAAALPESATRRADRPARADIPAGAVVIEAPMVGTFYRSPEPGARPFVEVGQAVTPESTVCIIEVMKLMNSINAGCAGKVLQVLVDDAQSVEMGQALIVIDPEG